MSADEKPLVESHVALVARIDPSDIVQGLENNDELILQFVCQVVALSHSSELRERLRERLGDEWTDEEYVP